MDPLSVSLAVVTFATAVKDIVELGQKIYESFANVSKNLRIAHRVAGNIKELVGEIQVFCDEHKDVLANMKDFGVALRGLLDTFRGFEASILPLLPKSGRRTLGLFIRGWWSNNKIQESIMDLESEIIKVMRGYMLKNAMRTEIKLETIHRETNRGLTGIAQGLEVIQRDVSELCVTAAPNTMTHYVSDSSGTTSDEFDRNIIMFAQSTTSTSAPMLRAPNMITEELMTVAYVKVQIYNIAMVVEKMSKMPTSAMIHVATNSVAPFQSSPMLKESSMNTMHLRHHVVRRVTHIRDLLESERIHTLSIHDSARALNGLATCLKMLGMRDESILVGTWAITLARLLFDASGSSYGPCLVFVLLSQSIRYSGTGDEAQGLQAIEEAHSIIQNIWNQYSGEQHFQILYSDVLLQHASFVDNKQAIKMSVEAIQVLEGVLNIRSFSYSNEKFEMVVRPSSSYWDHLFVSVPPVSAIQSYTCALQGLGQYMYTDGHREGPLDLSRFAISLCRKMVSVCGHEHKSSLTDFLLSLMSWGAASCISARELHDIADECAQLLRELVEKNPPYYARNLVSALAVKAQALDSMDQGAKAISAWEEVISLSGQVLQDSTLCAHALGQLSNQFRSLTRHDDAARTGMLAITACQTHEEAGTRAMRYYYLSRDLRQLHRHKESAEAARMSVKLHKPLVMRDPSGTYMSYLTISLSNVSRCLVALGDYSEVLIAWKEAMGTLENCLPTHTSASLDAIDGYCMALYAQIKVSLILKDEDECLQACSTAVQYLCQLAETHPQRKHVIHCLFWTEFHYVCNMHRLGRAHDAQLYADRWIDMQNSKPEVIPECEMAWWKAAMTALKASTLDAQGFTKQALLVSQQVHNIVNPFFSTYLPSVLEMLGTMIQMAQLHVSLGNNEEALKVAEEALRFSLESRIEPTTNGLVWSFYGIALTALSCQNFQRAVEAAREGYNICASPQWQSNSGAWELDMLVFPRLLACLSSAEANLGRCDIALNYAHRAVDASREMWGTKANAPTTTGEQLFMETRWNLAEILIATGDLALARHICEEGRTYFSNRVEKHMGEYRDLAPILRILGILCCAKGHHEEGEAAAQDLFHIIQMLGRVFSSLQEEVKIRLRNQAKVPILKVLDDMSEKLDCDHQKGIASLFLISLVK